MTLATTAARQTLAIMAPVEAVGTGVTAPNGWPAGVPPRGLTRRFCLVLHEPHDAEGPALAQALARSWHRAAAEENRGGAEKPQVQAMSSLALRMQARWALQVDATGTRCRLKLANGQVLDDAVLTAVINRLSPVSPLSKNAEACYQAGEWSALWLAWLHGLRCPVINRPNPVDPYLQFHDTTWWRQTALKAGLRVGPRLATGAGDWPPGAHLATCLVLAQQVLPDVHLREAGWAPDAELRRALRRLAELSSCDMLAVQGTFDRQGLWYFCHADAHPGMRAFGSAGTDALVRALQTERPREANAAATAQPCTWQRPSAMARRAGLVAVLGRETEGPCQLLLDAFRHQGTPAVMLDQRRLGPPEETWFNGLHDQHGKRVRLDHLHGLYLRPADTGAMGLPVDRAAMAAAQTQAWSAFAEWAPLTVVNRLSSMASNSSKPLQSQVLAALGFAIPPMLLTTRPEAVNAFEAEHGPLVFKSASGVRSIVCPLDAAARARMQQVRHAPTLFQKQLRGTNVRVHVVGDAVFATEIDSGAVDYRYAGRQGADAELRTTQLSLDLQGLCRQAAEQLGLLFAGIDLMLADDGEVYCFEVNPSPGYSWYQDATGQNISGALAELLSGRQC
jgi:hypothetical protein